MTTPDTQSLFDVAQANRPDNAFMHHNFITIEQAESNYAVGRLDIHPESLNPHGFVHGGGLYTLADNVCGVVAHSDGRSHVTLNGSLHFISNQGQGVIRATATVVHRGKTTCVMGVKLVGDDDRLIATGEFSFYCVGNHRVK